MGHVDHKGTIKSSPYRDKRYNTKDSIKGACSSSMMGEYFRDVYDE